MCIIQKIDFLTGIFNLPRRSLDKLIGLLGNLARFWFVTCQLLTPTSFSQRIRVQPDVGVLTHCTYFISEQVVVFVS